MYYFQVPFTAIINNDYSQPGHAGVISAIKDHRRNAVKQTAIDYFKERLNTRKQVAVVISPYITELPKEEFESMRNSFTIIVEEGDWRKSY